MRTLCAIAAVLVAAGPAVAQQQDRGPVEVPLRVHGPRLVVTAQAADGSDLDLILSTGNVVAVFSESARARLGDDPEVALSGVPLVTENSATVADESLTEDDGTVFDGIVGSNTLNQFDILVDAPGGRLVLKPFGRSVQWDGMTLSDPVRLRVYHGVVLSLDVELNGHEYGAMLDLGTSALVANPAVGDALGMEGSGTGTLSVGSMSLSDLPLRIEDNAVLQRFDPDGNGFLIVGAQLALDCAVSISWIHREIRTCVK